MCKGGEGLEQFLYRLDMTGVEVSMAGTADWEECEDNAEQCHGEDETSHCKPQAGSSSTMPPR